MGFSRGWDILKRRSAARVLIRKAAEKRCAEPKADDNDINSAGRLIARLVRNADEDLMEIKPDFSIASLRRLQRFLPVLLDEIENEEDALIRVGVVGTYLGEVACRNFQWQWKFKADPALKQFSYIVSAVQKGGHEVDPYTMASDWMLGKQGLGYVMGAVR